DHWQPLQLDLPVTSVRDIDVHGDDVVMATHGRAFWAIDDVTPLRQVDLNVGGAGAWLFAPATAVRVRPAGFTGTPLPKDEPRAENPPAGAYIDYVVGRGATGPVVISISDAQGHLVRRFSSDDRLPGTDLARIRVAPEWLAPPVAPSLAPGMHRLVWSLRHPAPRPLAEGNPYADGVWAPPGRYTVELSVGGMRQTRPLTVAPDPRVSLPAEAYARQFALARRVEALLARMAAAVEEADAAHKALAARSAADLDRQVQGLLGPDFGITPVAPPPAGLTPLRVLAATLRTLMAAVDGADAAPTPDAQAGLAKIEPAAEAALAAWQSLKANLPADAP
ncbi:MAG: hypothetical protein DMF78_12445, partial [Acidobacteria bacterium]